MLLTARVEGEFCRRKTWECKSNGWTADCHGFGALILLFVLFSPFFYTTTKLICKVLLIFIDYFAF